jgi:hypothetical protein
MVFDRFGFLIKIMQRGDTAVRVGMSAGRSTGEKGHMNGGYGF